ncbi:MAG: N-acetylmuramoyl-L-alanine amidase family protein [Lachnospiraceae bacterium]
MRKQTKIVAVASAAAVLAIGASMTSFAATGWVEEDGVWYYYDKDGNKVEDEWKKSGDSWYWLDSEEDGGMAVDKLIEDGDNVYYVDSNGTMVRNTWVKVVNEDQDDEDDPAEYNYYYMQSNGKAYKAGDTSTTKFRTIDGKRYAFDDDGKMLYGWVDGSGARLSGEDDWSVTDADVYYCGGWEDGAMKTGWQRIYVHDDLEDDDLEHWFYFKSNGKREYNSSGEDNIKEKKINGKRYGFDARGVMVYEWTLTTGNDSASSSDWKYFSSPEDGARQTKGWFKVVAPSEDNTFNSNTYTGSFAKTHADDEDEKWYYADGDGNLATGEIKKIKGKYYAFRPDDGTKGSAMLSGLVLMRVENGEIIEVLDDGIDADELDDILDKNEYDGINLLDAMLDDEIEYSLYYFGSDEDHDGAMKTGSTTVTLDGDSYSFFFNKSGGVESKGRGVTGVDDKKYIYLYGCRIKADSDDKYQIVWVSPSVLTGDNSISREGVVVQKMSSQSMRALAVSAGQNKDGETVRYVPYRAFNFPLGDSGILDGQMYLVNTGGTIVKSKTAAKDGDDWYFYVKDREIKMYTNNKTLPTSLSDWKDLEITIQ